MCACNDSCKIKDGVWLLSVVTKQHQRLTRTPVNAPPGLSAKKHKRAMHARRYVVIGGGHSDSVSFPTTTSVKCPGLTAAAASYVIQSGSNGAWQDGAVRQRWGRLCDKRVYVMYVGLRYLTAPVAVTERRTHRDHLQFLSPRTGPQQTIRLGAAVGRSGQGGGPFVAWQSEDGPVNSVTPWWISSCRLLTPLPCLSSPWPSRLQAPPSRRRKAKRQASGCCFQIKTLKLAKNTVWWSVI